MATQRHVVSAFQSFVCTKDDALALLALTRGHRSVQLELMPIVERLSRRPAGSVADVNEARETDAGKPATAVGGDTIRTLRDFFIGLVDERLQRLYRSHFEGSPPGLDAPHDRKIASLEHVRGRAEQIVASFDWRWLARWLRLESIEEDVGSCLGRLSNFAFDCDRVNFRFTYHCNISCRHCYNSSGPNARAQRIELEPMLGIIAQMPAVGIRGLNLTGGEPFMYPDDVMTLVAAGRKAGLTEISVYTNGFWALTPSHADRMLGRLKDAGFMNGTGDHLKVSAGVYHLEFIEFGRVVTLARAYHRAFDRRLAIDFELGEGRPELADDVRHTLAAEGLEDCVALRFRGVAPLGRGRDLPVGSLSPIDRPCQIINQITFDPDGSARPCCGLNNDNAGVKIGSLGQHSLRQLIKRMQNDPILQFLARHPMSEVFRYLDVKQNLLGYTGPCHLCQEALGGLRDREPLLRQLFDQQRFYPFWFTGALQPSGS